MVRQAKTIAIALWIAVGACTVKATGDDEVDGAVASADAGETRADAAAPEADAFEEGSCPRARVAVSEDATLRLREEPNTSSEVLGNLPNGTVVPVLDRVEGESISGDTEWLQVDYEGTVGFISGAFAECTTDPAASAAPPAGHDVPLGVG